MEGCNDGWQPYYEGAHTYSGDRRCKLHTDSSYVLLSERAQAIKIQQTLETLYKGVNGQYYHGEAAWEYVRDRTGVDLLGIFAEASARKCTSKLIFRSDSGTAYPSCKGWQVTLWIWCTSTRLSSLKKCIALEHETARRCSHLKISGLRRMSMRIFCSSIAQNSPRGFKAWFPFLPLRPKRGPLSIPA